MAASASSSAAAAGIKRKAVHDEKEAIKKAKQVQRNSILLLLPLSYTYPHDVILFVCVIGM
jgi:hypothetical protein